MRSSAYANLGHKFVEADLLHARGVILNVFRCVDQELTPTNSAQHITALTTIAVPMD